MLKIILKIIKLEFGLTHSTQLLYTQTSFVISSLHFESNLIISRLFGDIDYLVVDLSELNNKLLMSLLESKEKINVINEPRMFVQREIGISNAIEFDKQLENENEINSDKIIFRKYNKRSLNLLIKPFPLLLEKVDIKNILNIYDGFMLSDKDNNDWFIKQLVDLKLKDQPYVMCLKSDELENTFDKFCNDILLVNKEKS